MAGKIPTLPLYLSEYLFNSFLQSSFTFRSDQKVDKGVEMGEEIFLLRSVRYVQCLNNFLVVKKNKLSESFDVKVLARVSERIQRHRTTTGLQRRVIITIPQISSVHMYRLHLLLQDPARLRSTEAINKERTLREHISVDHHQRKKMN